MKLVQFVLKRPASVCMLVLAVIVFGMSALSGMPMGYMPDMEMPMELVMITWPGTDADIGQRPCRPGQDRPWRLGRSGGADAAAFRRQRCHRRRRYGSGA